MSPCCERYGASRVSPALQAIGVLGTLVILLAYGLVQLGRMDVNRLPYSVLNLVGAIAIVISLTDAFNLPSLILELAWSVISLYGIYRVLRSRAGGSRPR